VLKISTLIRRILPWHNGATDRGGIFPHYVRVNYQCSITRLIPQIIPSRIAWDLIQGSFMLCPPFLTVSAAFVDSNILSGKRWLGLSLVTLQNRQVIHFTVSVFLCWLPTNFRLGFIMQVLIQKPWKGHGPALQPATFFFSSACITSESVSMLGFQKPVAQLVCRRPSALGFAPSRGTPYSYLILIRSSSSSPLCSGCITHSILRNSWQFFLVERLSLHVI